MANLHSILQYPFYFLGHLFGKLEPPLPRVPLHPLRNGPCNSDLRQGRMVILVTHPSYPCLSYCLLRSRSCQSHPSLPCRTCSGKEALRGHLSWHLGLILASGWSQLPSLRGTLESSGHWNVYWAPEDLMPLFLMHENKKQEFKAVVDKWVWWYYNDTNDILT